MDSRTINDEICGFAADACVELLEAYGVPLSHEEAWEPDDEVLCGVVGIVGTGIRATCLLAADANVLRSSCPSGGALRDWAGELANQLIGRLKIKLLSRGVDVTLTTPLAFAGLKVTPSPSCPMTSRVFRALSGRVLVALDLETSAGFELGAFRPPACASTGDLFFFD